MKIAIILPSLAQKGPIIVAQEIVKGLVEKVDLVEVYYFDEICEVSFPCKTIRISFWDVIEFNKFDIIHSHMLRPDLYILKNRRYIKRAKIVSTLHQYNLPYLKDDFNIFIACMVSFIWTSALIKMDYVVSLTKHMMSYYKQSGLINTVCIYNGRSTIDIKNELHMQLDIAKAKYTILGTACFLIKRKGLEQVLHLLKARQDLFFAVIGDGPEKITLERLAAELNVLNRCLFLGSQSNPFVFYHYFDVFVLPTRNEGMPMALLEAASCKKSVVCSRIPVLEELYTDEEVSFFDLDDVTSLSLSVDVALEKKEIHSKNLHCKYITSQTSEYMSKAYLTFYSSIVNVSKISY